MNAKRSATKRRSCSIGVRRARPTSEAIMPSTGASKPRMPKAPRIAGKNNNGPVGYTEPINLCEKDTQVLIGIRNLGVVGIGIELAIRGGSLQGMVGIEIVDPEKEGATRVRLQPTEDGRIHPSCGAFIEVEPPSAVRPRRCRRLDFIVKKLKSLVNAESPGERKGCDGGARHPS